MLVAQSCLTLCKLMDYSCQAPLSMEFSRQEYWSGLPYPPPGDLLDLGIFWTQGSNPLSVAGRFFTVWATREAHTNSMFTEAHCGNSLPWFVFIFKGLAQRSDTSGTVHNSWPLSRVPPGLLQGSSLRGLSWIQGEPEGRVRNPKSKFSLKCLLPYLIPPSLTVPYTLLSYYFRSDL